METKSATVANVDTHGYKVGESIYINYGKKAWYVRLFHFVTFKKFEEPEPVYTITSVDGETSITFCTGEHD